MPLVAAATQARTQASSVRRCSQKQAVRVLVTRRHDASKPTDQDSCVPYILIYKQVNKDVIHIRGKKTRADQLPQRDTMNNYIYMGRRLYRSTIATTHDEQLHLLELDQVLDGYLTMTSGYPTNWPVDWFTSSTSATTAC